MTGQFVLPFPEAEPTYREKAAQWIVDNPSTMALFERFALELAARGRRFGIKAIAERVRWEERLHSPEPPKINDHFTAYVARHLARKHPHIAGLIETRVTKAANKPYRGPHFDQRVDPLTDQPMEDGDA